MASGQFSEITDNKLNQMDAWSQQWWGSGGRHSVCAHSLGLDARCLFELKSSNNPHLILTNLILRTIQLEAKCRVDENTAVYWEHPGLILVLPSAALTPVFNFLSSSFNQAMIAILIYSILCSHLRANRMPKCCALLNVTEDDSIKTIEKAFRLKSATFHPDVCYTLFLHGTHEWFW